MSDINPSPAVLAAVASLLSLPAAAQNVPDDLRVFSYASQVNDVDAVNSHWFQTDAGVVLIDAQRLLPEAERALAHLRATTALPVVAIVISHAHTDHYGGLPVWMEAFPEAQVYTDRATLASIREDGRGFIAARGERHGDRFATQAALDEAVARAIVVEGGERLEIGDAALIFDVLAASEAESHLVTEVEGERTAFVGDLVNVGTPAVPFEDIDAWLMQLDALEARFDPGDRLYIGHGPAPTDPAEIAEQRRYLEALRSGVSDALEDDGTLDTAEAEELVFTLEAGWPFYEGVAGLTRQEVLSFSVARIAEQLGGEVQGTDG